MKNNQSERPSVTRYRIEIKVSEDQKATIVRGAGIAKQAISEFVRNAASKRRNN